TDSIAVILSEARKYKLCLTMAHQYVGQLVDNGDSTIKDAVFGNVGTIGAYRVGVEDAELFAKQFEPIFNEYDVMNVDQYTFNLKLLIDNTHARPFNVKGRALPTGNPQMVEAIKELSRLKYGRDRNIVESEIAKRSAMKPAPLKISPLKSSAQSTTPARSASAPSRPSTSTPMGPPTTVPQAPPSSPPPSVSNPSP
ncbi:hypothetical protein KKA01_03955, partial [Patescibacteria group bacterium]|nr:hypothetical protein [Patescibacteria group bacterium]